MTSIKTIDVLNGLDQYWSETFESVDFSQQILTAKEFDGCTFTHCNFSDATFKRCNFADCEFVNCNLSMVNIDYSKFSEVLFRDSKLIGINWTKVAWPRLLFNAPVVFKKSILNDCSFFGLALQNLCLEECKAHNVDFREGNFSSANFTYTDFSGSLFSHTELSGADFCEAVNYDIDVYQNTIKAAKFSRFEAVRLLGSLEIDLFD